MNAHRRAAALLLLSIAACDVQASPTEPWMAPPKVGGKADAIATLTGAEIPSDFADDDTSYLHDRSISALEQVGALEGALGEVARRADGIIDALPADGRLDVEELVRMEESPYFDLLFPEEQAALPELWPLLAVPDEAIEAFDLDDLEALEIDDRSVEPGDLQLPDWLPIEAFSSGVQDALRRMELAFDDDGDDGTVALGDIDGALAAPGAFTPSEIANIERARDEFLAHGESLLQAVTGVPAPGESVAEATLGEVTLARTATTTLEERHGSTVWRDQHSESYQVTLELERSAQTWPSLGEGQQLLVIESLQERDAVLGAEVGSLAAGTYLVELWEGGARVDVLWAALPALGDAVERLDLSDRVSHRLETLDGTPLQSTVVAASARTSNWYTQYTAEYVWDVGAVPTVGDVDPSVVSRLAIPHTTLEPGRYATVDESGEELLLDVFPEGALRASYRGETAWMYQNSNGSTAAWARRYAAQTGGRYVHFQAAENRLQAWQNLSNGTHYYANVVVVATDRQG